MRRGMLRCRSNLSAIVVAFRLSALSWSGIVRSMFSGNRRYLALFFPLLSADRWQREAPSSDSVPRVFVEKRRGAMRLVARSTSAER